MSKRLDAILGKKCPVCLEGLTFRKGLTMNAICRVCGHRFEREQGYFVGALYLSYFLAIPILAASTGVIWLVSGWTPGHSMIAALIVFVPMAPTILRYARVLWMHLDLTLDPPPSDATLDT
jgi:uncharacterized protein (DUF983 family)